VYDNVAGQRKVYLLRFYATKEEAKEYIPPFLEVIRDVRYEKEYKLR
jgi:hypothetical protein